MSEEMRTKHEVLLCIVDISPASWTGQDRAHPNPASVASPGPFGKGKPTGLRNWHLGKAHGASPRAVSFLGIIVENVDPFFAHVELDIGVSGVTSGRSFLLVL